MGVKIDENDYRSTQIIKSIMRSQHITLQQLADMTGCANPSNISMYMKSDMKFSRFEQLLSAMNYEIFIGSKESDEAMSIDELIGK